MTTNTYTIRLSDAEVAAVACDFVIVGNVMTLAVGALDEARRRLDANVLKFERIERKHILAISRVRRKLEKAVKECGGS